MFDGHLKAVTVTYTGVDDPEAAFAQNMAHFVGFFEGLAGDGAGRGWGYRELCGKRAVNVAFINNRVWFMANETTQQINKKDFPIGPSRKWSVGVQSSCQFISRSVASLGPSVLGVGGGGLLLQTAAAGTILD